MATDLPNEFDVIVLGTGLPETLLAAAFSRIGLTVLHLDRNTYYSGSWASFSLRQIPSWINEQKKSECYASQVDAGELSSLVKEGEKALQLPETFHVVSDIQSQYHVRERPQESPEVSSPLASSTSARAVDNEAVAVPSPEAEAAVTAGEGSTANSSDQSDQPADHTETTVDVVAGQFDSVPEEGEDSPTEQGKGETETEAEVTNTTSTPEKMMRREWYLEDIEKEWRKFSFDLAPKLLYCSSSMVELLIVSDVAKYCEFRTVSRVLTMRDGNLEKVPCSRADVFSSKALSLLEKRLLMKFLTFAAEYDKQPQEYRDFSGRPFVEFLASKKMSSKIQHFILHSIAMATEATSTEQGLESTQKFLRSLGRYGNTAFLFPLYGSGELPQGFCRLSAVFGGIYVLTLSVSHLLINNENKCSGIITSAGQRIACKYLIADPSYLPKEFYQVPDNRLISRGIYVTDSSILQGEGEDLSLLQFPNEGQPSSPTTTVLELPPSAMVSPKALYVVHMTRTAVSDVQTDLQPAESTLFQDTGASGNKEAEGEGSDKPKVLWSLMFQQRDLSCINSTDLTPSNVFVTTGPGVELDTDRCVEEAKTVFKEICPEEEFLPKPPHPDDIIYVDTEEVPAVGNDQGDWVASGTMPAETGDGADGSTDKAATRDEPLKDEEKEEKSGSVESTGEGCEEGDKEKECVEKTDQQTAEPPVES